MSNLREITQDELDEILRKHKIWIESDKKEGERENLSGTDLSRKDLSGAYLSDAFLSGANLSRANLSGADLSAADLNGANFSGADLSGANFRDADLSGAILSYANLKEADLRNADLSGTNFTEADIMSANFQYSIMDGKTLISACKIDKDTDFRGVGLDNARIDSDIKGLLKYNIRRKNWEDWYEKHKWLKLIVKPFWWISDYGSSTGRLITAFLILSLLFASVYSLNPEIIKNLQPTPSCSALSCGMLFLRAIYFSIVTMTSSSGVQKLPILIRWFARLCGPVPGAKMQFLHSSANFSIC